MSLSRTAKWPRITFSSYFRRKAKPLEGLVQAPGLLHHPSVIRLLSLTGLMEQPCHNLTCGILSVFSRPHLRSPGTLRAPVLSPQPSASWRYDHYADTVCARMVRRFSLARRPPADPLLPYRPEPAAYSSHSRKHPEPSEQPPSVASLSFPRPRCRYR